jgi:Long-chain fatty acid transport protein
MKFRAYGLMALAASAGLLSSGSAFATDGYFSAGYGMKANGRGGSALAWTDDAFGGANNPATMVFAGSRTDVGLTLFSPFRGSSRTGSDSAANLTTQPLASTLLGLLGNLGIPTNGGRNYNAKSNNSYFPIPEFGYNHMWGRTMAFGIDVVGNGGLNTNYSSAAIQPPDLCVTTNNGGNVLKSFETNGNFNPLCGHGSLGVNLIQMLVIPTISMRLSDHFSVGISPIGAVQTFEAKGLDAFQNSNYTIAPNQLTNKGTDISYGYGGKAGILYKVRYFSFGAMYQSKIYMTPFNRYAGLFAQGGKFDIPSTYGAGITITPVQRVTFGFDFDRINYNEVASVHNPSTNIQQIASNPNTRLGGSQGPGFGWQSINVLKAGVQVRATDRLTLRGGYNHTDNPIQARDVTFNILAPGVVQDHASFGFTYKLSHHSEVTGMYTHVFGNSVTGPSLQFPFLGPNGTPVLNQASLGGTETIYMYQNYGGLQYSYKF